MDRAFPRLALFACLLALTGCNTSQHPLPEYEPPLAHVPLQTVRTTAYTHTEADHVQYGNRNALGGTLRAASAGSVMPVMISPTPAAPVAMPVGGSIVSPRTVVEDADDDETGGFHRTAYVPSTMTAPMSNGARGNYDAAPPPLPPPPPNVPLVYGSAAADWSRWPAGTVFQILSTGQLYRVDDYGWALAGRNTIDLYMPTRSAMNAWAVRRVPIRVLRWGDPDESLRILRPREKYKHIRRMVLELEGKHRAAARLR